jgi:hypothetical protein
MSAPPSNSAAADAVPFLEAASWSGVRPLWHMIQGRQVEHSAQKLTPHVTHARCSARHQPTHATFTNMRHTLGTKCGGKRRKLPRHTHECTLHPSTARTLSARPFSTSTSAPAFTSARTISGCTVLTAINRAVWPR